MCKNMENLDELWLTVMSVYEEMMDARGYKKGDIKHFSKMHDTNAPFLNIPTYKNNITGDEIYLFIIREKLSIELYRIYTNIINELGCKHVILIAQDAITANVLTEINNTQKNKQNNDANYCDIEIFRMSELFTNILNHEFVPKHEVVPESCVINNKFQPSKLPRIFSKDPICKFLHIVSGYVKITRKDGSVCFRIVI